MFEDKVLDAAIETMCFEPIIRSEYFILTHHKHKREMYFKIDDQKRALNFVKLKFKGFKKRVIFAMLRLGILQPFLRKIKLPSKIGSLVLVAGQIKGFNFDKKIVYSFPNSQWDDAKFVKDKITQIKMSNLGFAPKIYMLDKKYPYSFEELCEPYDGDVDTVIKRLKEFYKVMPGYIHGEFAIQQVVKKDDKLLFVDWDLRKGDQVNEINKLYKVY